MRTRFAACLGFGTSLALAACGSDSTTTIVDTDAGASPPKVLVSTAATAANAQCPEGGTTVSVGYDTNGNGALDPSEVSSSEEICTPATADGGRTLQVLTTETASNGDDMCANGGIIFQSGVDTNGNGVLDPSEVTSSQEICTGRPAAVTDGGAPDSAGTGGPYFSHPLTPPPAVANQPAFTIDTSGGSSETGQGASGGQILLTHAGTLGGNLAVYTTGLAATAFVMPAYSPSYGNTVLDALAATPVTVGPTGSAATPYFVNANNNNELDYYVDATHILPVTGIHVGAGATLTLTVGDMGPVTNDIVVEGTVTNAAGSNDVRFQTAGAFVGGPHGAIVTSTSGGSVVLLAAAVYNEASITTQRGNTSGVSITTTAPSGASAPLYNSGAITVGDQPAENSGSVDITANGGNLYNSGVISANGGGGEGPSDPGVGEYSAGAAGSGGAISLTVNGRGDMLLGGAMTARGGAIDPSCTSGFVDYCSGGNGGQITINESGGRLATSATIDLSGGVGIGGGSGGLGGAFAISCSSGTGILGEPVPYGDVDISGNINLRGGNGGSYGGDQGGNFTINQVAPPNPNGAQVSLLGYSNIITNGGHGYPAGGLGGILYLFNAASAAGSGLTATGGVANYATISASGGNGLGPAALGGSGGFVLLSANSAGADADGDEAVLSSAPIDVSAGSGTVESSVGAGQGGVKLVGAESVTNTAAIAALGGAITMVSSGAVANSGLLSSGSPNVSAASTSATNAPAITLTAGSSLVNSASMQDLGGNSAGGVGGNGGNISLTAGTTFSSGAPAAIFTATGGTGTVNGTNGIINLNGVIQ